MLREKQVARITVEVSLESKPWHAKVSTISFNLDRNKNHVRKLEYFLEFSSVNQQKIPSTVENFTVFFRDTRKNSSFLP